MTDRHDLPQDPALSGLYRAGAGDGPPPALDARILAAAHAAARPPALPRPWWKRLTLPVGVAASALLAAMLSLTVQRHPPETVAPADDAAAARAPQRVPPAASPTVAAPASARQAASPPEEKKARTAAPAAPAPVLGPAPLPAQAPPAPAAAESFAAPAAKSEIAADRAVAAERAPQGLELRAAPAPAGVAARQAAPAPAAWIEEIRELRRQGQAEAAARRLAEFRRAHPDYPLPDDLK